jgi:hypothetical protein
VLVWSRRIMPVIPLRYRCSNPAPPAASLVQTGLPRRPARMDLFQSSGEVARVSGGPARSECRPFLERPSEPSGKVPDTHSVGSICNHDLSVFIVTEIAMENTDVVPPAHPIPGRQRRLYPGLQRCRAPRVPLTCLARPAAWQSLTTRSASTRASVIAPRSKFTGKACGYVDDRLCRPAALPPLPERARKAGKWSPSPTYPQAPQSTKRLMLIDSKSKGVALATAPTMTGADIETGRAKA